MRSAVSDVVGGLRLVNFDRLDPETRVQVERVAAAGDTLASLVEFALLIASGAEEDASVEPNVPLSVMLDHWRRRWTGHAEAVGVELEIVTNVDPFHDLLVPSMTVDRIVSNVLSNALDHAASAKVRLTVRQEVADQLLIEVADAGAGFDPNSVAREPATGHGLGLQIAKELSRRLGGALTITNGPPLGGAVVQLVVPPENIAAASDDIGAEMLPDLSQLSILVAEDNPTNQAILRNMLESLGARPVLASDGVEALAILEQTRFDIALIDIEMPRLSGLEVMRKIRAAEGSTGRMPLVALTAYVLRDNREAIYAAGADGIIGKPVSSTDEFGRTILRYLGRPAGLPEPEDLLTTGAEDPALGVKMNETRLEELLKVAGPDGAAELLSRLSEDLCGVREKLAAGVAARSVPQIREQTHILIAIAGAVGADRLCRLSEVLNIAAKRQRLEDLEALHLPCRDDLDDLIALIASRSGPL